MNGLSRYFILCHIEYEFVPVMVVQRIDHLEERLPEISVDLSLRV